VLAAACREPGAGPAADVSVERVYSRETGRLQQIKADRDQDGVIDTIASMDGARLLSIAIDRDNDGHADRWEYYEPGSGQGSAGIPLDRLAVIVRAEESARPDGAITRREFFERGVIARAEEDTALAGRVDKWEFYTAGTLERIDLDLQRRGTPDRRLIYGASGDVDRIESDPDGDGVFVVLASTASSR
jgi:hypothetical protein